MQEVSTRSLAPDPTDIPTRTKIHSTSVCGSLHFPISEAPLTYTHVKGVILMRAISDSILTKRADFYRKPNIHVTCVSSNAL